MQTENTALTNSYKQLKSKNQEIADELSSTKDELNKLTKELNELKDRRKKQMTYKDYVNYEQVIEYVARHPNENTNDVLMSMLEAIIPKEGWDYFTADIEKMAEPKGVAVKKVVQVYEAGSMHIDNIEQVENLKRN